MASITIKLGDREYEIAEPGWGAAEDWIDRWQELNDRVIKIAGASNDDAPVTFDAVRAQMDLAMQGAGREIFDLVIALSPVLADDIEYIHAHATRTQIFDAYQEAVKMMRPFAGVEAIGRGLSGSGLGARSPVRNGGYPPARRTR